VLKASDSTLSLICKGLLADKYDSSFVVGLDGISERNDSLVNTKFVKSE